MCFLFGWLGVSGQDICALQEFRMGIVRNIRRLILTYTCLSGFGQAQLPVYEISIATTPVNPNVSPEARDLLKSINQI
jgi:hypothetical protein